MQHLISAKIEVTLMLFNGVQESNIADSTIHPLHNT